MVMLYFKLFSKNMDGEYVHIHEDGEFIYEPDEFMIRICIHRTEGTKIGICLSVFVIGYNFS